MRLRGREGNELDLAIVGYEHPENRVDPWDSNSLLVSVRVVAPQGTWEVVDPCLTTWEAARVASYLTAVAIGRAAGGRLTLVEPNVSFTAAQDPHGVELRACFELESRPPWAHAAAGARDLCVDLGVHPRDLATAAASLRAELRRFPQRGDDPTL